MVASVQSNLAKGCIIAVLSAIMAVTVFVHLIHG